MTEHPAPAGDDGLARLVRRGEHQGASLDTLAAIVAQASERGARRALAQCGLQDRYAGDDIRELRALLDAWRDTKKTARQTIIRWLVRAILGFIAFAVAVKLKWLSLGTAPHP